MSLIEINEAAYTYPNGFTAVENINLKIEKADNLAIIGQNGAGKTTMVKLLNGLLKPGRGSVIVNGKNTKKHTTAQISRDVGYVFQNPDDQIFNNRVYDEIGYALVQAGASESEIKERVNKYSKLCGVDHLLQENPYDLPLSIRKLVTIASVISTQAEVIILDEPTAGQDELGLTIISDIIATLIEEKRAVITITHDMEFVARHFEKIIVMADKNIQKIGSPEEIFFDNHMMEVASLKPPVIVQVIQRLGLKVQTLSSKELARVVNEF